MALSKQQAKEWIEQNAEWYSQHREYPVCRVATEAAGLHSQAQDSSDYSAFIYEQFYNHAQRVFKRLGLDMRNDA